MFLIERERLTLHPLTESLTPLMTENEFDAFLKSIVKWGIRDPIEILPLDEKEEFYQIIDGRHRYLAACKLNLKKVPVVVVDLKKEEIEEYILLRALKRRNLTPEQKACLAINWIEKQKSSKENITNLIKKASKFFSVRKETIYIILKLKSNNPSIFDALKEGTLTLYEVKELDKLINKGFELPNIINKDFILAKEEIDKICSKKISDIQEKELQLREQINKITELEKRQKDIEKKLKNSSKEKTKLKELLSVMYLISKELLKEKKNKYNDLAVISPVSDAEITNLLQKVSNINFESINNLPETQIKETLNEETLRVEHILLYFLSFLRSEEIRELYYILQQKSSKIQFTEGIVKKINEIFDELQNFQDIFTKTLMERVLISPGNESEILNTQKQRQYFLLRRGKKNGE